MTTIVSNSKTQPAIVMDRVHIDSFTFKQERTDNPHRVIGMSGVRYGFDDVSSKVFDIETVGVSDPDLDNTVVAAHVAAGGTIESFTVEYLAAKTQVSNEFNAGTLTDSLLMAYFEAALGRIFELHGKFTIAGVE